MRASSGKQFDYFFEELPISFAESVIRNLGGTDPLHRLGAGAGFPGEGAVKPVKGHAEMSEGVPDG